MSRRETIPAAVRWDGHWVPGVVRTGLINAILRAADGSAVLLLAGGQWARVAEDAHEVAARLGWAGMVAAQQHADAAIYADVGVVQAVGSPAA